MVCASSEVSFTNVTNRCQLYRYIKLAFSLKNTNQCNGDSGGPLVCNGKLTGIISWGGENCAGPGISARVSEYANWIKTRELSKGSTLKSMMVLQFFILLWNLLYFEN